MGIESFPRKERLKSFKLIRKLFAVGHRKAVYPILMFYLPLKQEEMNETVQVGFSVSRKKFKGAVDRNLIKRRMREAYRHERTLVKDKLRKEDKHLAIFFVYIGNDIEAYQPICSSMRRLLQSVNP
jgi:ribonuclease P protein component